MKKNQTQTQPTEINRCLTDHTIQSFKIAYMVALSLADTSSVTKNIFVCCSKLLANAHLQFFLIYFVICCRKNDRVDWQQNNLQHITHILLLGAYVWFCNVTF